MNDCLKILSIVFCICHNIQAQSYYFKHYDVDEGLTHNTVHCVVQDDKGFMWFGTKNGLNRYDGYSFKWYQNLNDELGTLGSNFIESLHFFKQKLYVGTDVGLYVFDSSKDKFGLIEISENKPILDIENDSQGHVWFIASSDIYSFETETGDYKHFQLDGDFQAEELAFTPNGKLWAASPNNLFEYDPQAEIFVQHELTLNANYKFPFSISKIKSLNENTLIIGTVSHGAFIYDISNKSLIKMLSKEPDGIYVRDFLIDGNNLWIATETGIYIYNLFSQEYIQLTKQYGNPYSLSDNAVYCLFKDADEGFWIGTYFGGINYNTYEYSRFEKFYPKGDENSISGSAVREIHKDWKGNFWIGTENGGLNKWDVDSKAFSKINLENSRKEFRQTNVHGILMLQDEIWIGTFQDGLHILDLGTYKVKKQFKAGSQSGLKSNFIVDLYLDRNGVKYVISSSGIYRFDEKEERFFALDGFPADYFFTTFLQDNEGGLWAGTYWDGLYYFHPDTGVRKVFKKSDSGDKCLSSNAINSIFQSSDHTIWVATENGLNKYVSNGKFETFTVKDGFPSSVFYTIVEDFENNLWISTANGLVRYTPGSKQISVYNKENGLLSNQFNYSSGYRDDESGRLYFGSVEGMISFDPRDESFLEKPTSRTLVLTDIEINNERPDVAIEGSLLQKAVSYMDTLNLNHNQSSLHVYFANPTYKSPALTKYAYQLDGLQDEWIDIGNKNTIHFTELPPGDYRLNLRFKPPNQEWSDGKQMLAITIRPSFWGSNLGYLLYFSFICILLYSIARYYHIRTVSRNRKRIQRLNIRKEREIYKSKIEFFTNISHEILTPITLIKNPLDKLVREKVSKKDLNRNLKIMQKNTNRLLALIQQLLDFRKTENQHIRLTFVKTNITELILDVILRFSVLAKEKSITVNHNLNGQKVMAWIDEEATKKIISNLYSNAIKYCDQNVILELSQNSEEFCLTIKNDGVLIPINLRRKIFEPFFRVPGNTKELGTGIGLSLAHSLAELQNGSLELDILEKDLNTFTLKIPIHQEGEFRLEYPNKIENKAPFETRNTFVAISDRHYNVLLVEDNEDLLNFMSAELKKDFAIFKATNGKEALLLLKNEHIHLVISDIKMPVMDGYELCEKIKADAKLGHIPVIMLTSKNTSQSKIRGLESGADAYISKPFSMDVLEVQIKNLLHNRVNIVNHFTKSPLAHIKSIAHNDEDAKFLEKLDKTISENITDPNLNVQVLGEIMYMSRSTLYRKIKDLSGLSPNEFINLSRLRKAAELLKTKSFKIYEVSEMVGYNSVTSFGRNFQKKFQMSPSEFIDNPN